MEQLASSIDQVVAIACALAALCPIVGRLLVAGIRARRAVLAELAIPDLMEIHTGARPRQSTS